MKYCYESSLSKSEWDEFVIKKKGDYRQFYNWGILKIKYKWQVLRLCINENDELISSCQLIIKTKGPLIFIYLPGSINGQDENLSEVIKFLNLKYKKFFFKYFRADLTNSLENEYLNLKKKININRAIYKRSGNTKLVIPIFKNKNEQIKNTDKNFKKSLKISSKRKIDIVIDKNPDTSMVYRLSRQLEIDKKLGKGHSHEEVRSIFSIFKKNIIFSKAHDEFNNILGFRAAIFQGHKAWDFFAVTTNHGRSLKAGFPLMISLLDEAKKKNIKKYYFIGDDEIKKKNVFKFKNSLGGKKEKYIGEIEWCNFAFIKIIINIILFLNYSSFAPSFFKKH